MFRCHPASRASSSQKSRTRVPSGLVPAALLVESRVSVVAGVSGRGPGRLGCADCRRCSRLALFFGLEDLDCLVRTTCPAFLDALLLALLSVQPARSRIARNPSVVAAPKSARYLLGGGGVSRRFLVIALSPLVAPALCVTCRGCAAFPGVRVRGVQCRDCRGGPGGVQAATNRWTGTSSRSCCACRRSYCNCCCNQLSALPPKACERRMAISGEIPSRPLSSIENVLRETARPLAASVTVSPSGSRHWRRMNAPGWGGSCSRRSRG